MWPSVFREQENRVYDLPSCLLKDRYILINQEIDDEFASSVVAQLLFLESEQPDAPIKMIINSPGGSISAGMAIYDTLNNVKCPIITIANGMAASMAAFLLCSGSKGKRYAMPNSTIMIHQPLGGVQGQATEIEIVAKRILGLREKLYTIMAENTNGKTSYEEMAKACERDNYLTPEEALEMGLIDEIIKTPNKATM